MTAQLLGQRAMPYLIINCATSIAFTFEFNQVRNVHIFCSDVACQKYLSVSRPSTLYKTPLSSDYVQIPRHPWHLLECAFVIRESQFWTWTLPTFWLYRHAVIQNCLGVLLKNWNGPYHMGVSSEDTHNQISSSLGHPDHSRWQTSHTTTSHGLRWRISWVKWLNLSCPSLPWRVVLAMHKTTSPAMPS
jgi:hypothetical protein